MSDLLYHRVDPKKYLELAEELATESDDAARRSAADRAYYAAFLTCRDVLAEKNYLTPYYSSDDHRYIAEKLRSPKLLGIYGNNESLLRKARDSITYDTRELAANHEKAKRLEWMIKTAREIIDKVQALPVNPDWRR